MNAICRQLTLLIYCSCGLFAGVKPAPVEAQCRNVAISIAHGVKSRKDVRAALGLVIYQQNLSTGAITFIDGSSVGFAAGQKKQVTAKGSGSVESVQIDGDIAGVFKSVTINGSLTLDIQGRGAVPARLSITAKKLSLKRVKVKGRLLTKVDGKTTFTIVDSVTGERLFGAALEKFGKLRTFGFEWEDAVCGIRKPPGGNVKR